MSRASNLAGFTTSISPPTNLSVGIITAISFFGSGSGLTGVGLGTTGSINTSGIITATSVVVSAGTTALPSISPTGDTNTGIFFPAADTIAFGEGGAEAMRVDSSGRLLIGISTSGNVNGGILQLGSGITFPATAVAATDANTLDDYEEGTWTPSVGGTATYSSQNGTYTKIGRTVTINFSLNITLLGTGSNYQISGLPFNVGLQGYGATGYFAGLAANVIGLTCNVTGTTVLFNSMNASGSTATNNPLILGNSCLIQGSVTYFN